MALTSFISTVLTFFRYKSDQRFAANKSRHQFYVFTSLDIKIWYFGDHV